MGNPKLLFYLTIITGFIGPILAIPSYPELFAFKFVFLIHALAFIPTVLQRKGWEMDRRIKGYLWFLAFWLGWAVVSFLWVGNYQDGLRHLQFLMGMNSFVLFSLFYLDNIRDLSTTFRIMVVLLAGFVVLGVIETQTGWHLSTSVVNTYTQAYRMYRPTAVFWNTNDFATYLSLFLPYSFGLIKYSKVKNYRILGLFLYATGLYLIVFTESRANILAILLGLVTLFILSSKESKRRMTILVILGLAVVLVILMVFSPIIAESSFWIRTERVMTNLYRLPEGVFSDRGSVFVRSRLIVNGLTELHNHYYLGVGIGNAEHQMLKYADTVGGVVNLHNWWIEVLVNYGIFVWLGYIGFYLKIIKDLYQTAKHSTDPVIKKLTEILTISMVSFSIACVSPSSLAHHRHVWFLFAYALAVLNTAYKMERVRKGGLDSEGANYVPPLSQHQ